MVVILNGPERALRTATARALAVALGWPFLDGDAVSADGPPRPAALNGKIAAVLGRRGHLVVACSPLADAARAEVRGDLRGVRFVALTRGVRTDGSRLREVDDVVLVNAAWPRERILAAIRYEFGL